MPNVAEQSWFCSWHSQGVGNGLQGASLGLVYGDKLIQAGAEPCFGETPQPGNGPLT